MRAEVLQMVNQRELNSRRINATVCTNTNNTRQQTERPEGLKYTGKRTRYKTGVL